MFKNKEESSINPIRHEGRTGAGFAWHIQADPAGETNFTAVCGVEMFNFARSNTNITVEYLKNVVEVEKVQHRNFFYCKNCYEKFVGSPLPEFD